MRSELEEKQEVMHSLQETADRLCQENHPAKQTVEVRLPSNKAIKAVHWPFKVLAFHRQYLSLETALQSMFP